jgi:hypothetical protein
MQSIDELPIACSLTDRELARRAEDIRRDLFSGALERSEFETGYAFRFPADQEWETKIVEFVSTERQCCPFFRFDVKFEPNHGPIWLKLSGGEGVKQFIEATFLD